MPTKDGKHAYTEEEKAEIIAHVLVGVACGRFVSRVFREDLTTRDGVKMPNQDTFYYWLFQDDQSPDGSERISEKLARARRYGIEALLDETVDIADYKELDTVRDDEGNERPNTEWISRSKLRIDTRIKLAQMMNPKKYGAKLDLTSGGDKIDMAEQVRRGIARARAQRAEEGDGE